MWELCDKLDYFLASSPGNPFLLFLCIFFMWSYIKPSKMHYIAHSSVGARSPQHSVFKDIHLGCDFASIYNVFCSISFINLCKHKVKYVLKVWFVHSPVAQLQRKWSVDHDVCLMEEPPGTIIRVQQGKSAVQGRKNTQSRQIWNWTLQFLKQLHLTAACQAELWVQHWLCSLCPQGGHFTPVWPSWSGLSSILIPSLSCILHLGSPLS